MRAGLWRIFCGLPRRLVGRLPLTMVLSCYLEELWRTVPPFGDVIELSEAEEIGLERGAVL